MKKPLVSVIIPTYNAENTLETCLKSVLEQTYDNLEIIVVNDGSTDNTLKIAKSFKSVTVLSKSNGGPSSARNYGIKFANGSYVCFLDADDYLEKDFVQKMMSFSTNQDNEIIVSGFLLNGVPEPNWSQFETTAKEEIFSEFLNHRVHNRTPNKIYSSALIKTTSFPIGQDIMEDAYFTAHVLEKCGRLVRVDYFGYHYNINEGSLSNRKLTKKQSAGKQSNLLERDLVISKYIKSKKDIQLLVEISLEHIIHTIDTINNIMIFSIFDKIKTLLDFLKINCVFLNNNERNLVNKLYNCANPKKLKWVYFKYKFWHSSFKDKMYLMYKVLLKRNK